MSTSSINGSKINNSNILVFGSRNIWNTRTFYAGTSASGAWDREFLRELELNQSRLAEKVVTLGNDHPSTLDIVDNIAITFHILERYEEALEMYQRALFGKEKVLGFDHPSTLDIAGSMAIVFCSLARYDEAIEMYQKALAGKEKVLGKDHPSTLDIVGNMAIVFRGQGRYEEALQWHQRALAGKEKEFGSAHPSTLDTFDNIAVTVRSQGLYHHYHDLDTVESMVNIFCSRKLYVDKALERSLLAENKTPFGGVLSSTLKVVNDIADIFDRQFLSDKALLWYRRALMVYEKVLGKTHPETLRIVHNMVGVFYDLGREEEARKLEQRAQVRDEISLGNAEHSSQDTANIGDPTTGPSRNGYVLLNSTKYNKVKQIGSGNFGTAWLIESQSNRENLVCKEVFALGEDRKKYLTSFMQECSLLKIADHPNIVRFISFQPPDAIDGIGRVYMEYCEGGDLKNFRKGRSFTEETAWKIIFQLAAGLAYLHHGLAIHTTPCKRNRFYIKNRWKTILHRDIKPSNVLVSKIHENEITVKLCDFGIGKIHVPDMTGTYIGTNGFIAPEITRESASWTPKADIFSLGRTIAYLNTQTRYPSIQSLADDCMKKEPKDRPSSLKLLEIAGRHISDDAFKVKRWENCSFLAVISVGRIEVTTAEDQKNILERFRLLQEDGVDINQITYSWYYDRPLHLAARSGNITLARRLLADGAKVNAVNAKQQTAFHIAKKKNNQELVKLLLKNGSWLTMSAWLS